MYINTLIKYRNIKGLKKIIQRIMLMLGLDLPSTVKLGKNVQFPHNAIGTVIHNNTIIEDNVKIYQNVTLGRADIYRDMKDSKMSKIIVKENAVICAGAKVLCKSGTLIIGKNTVIGANAVITESTGDNEIWAGIPARKIRDREDV